MKLYHYPESDSLYIELSPAPSALSHAVADGVTLELAADGHVVGIDIDRASARVDLGVVETLHLPAPRTV